MSSVAATDTYIIPETYIALERKAKVKSEYIHGEILAMSGASLAHTLITLDIACTAYGFLDHSLKEDCDTIQSH